MVAEGFSRRRLALVEVALAIATVLAYWRLFGNDFVNLDDTIYVYQNHWVQRGLTLDSIRWAFGFEDKHATYWQPLTWLSLMLDHRLFGLRPVGYHSMNLLLHVANVCLLFATLRRMTKALWCSALVAALFALHPINVESVAWVAERKNVLSSFFFMLSLYAYSFWAERRTWWSYLAVFLSMALGLMAKSMLVILPFALLLLDFWPLRRLRLPSGDSSPPSGGVPLTELLVEKIPLGALSALSVAVSVLSMKGRYAPARQPVPLPARLSEALVSYVRYLGKLAWPADLAVYYPSRATYPLWEVAGSAFLLLAVTALAASLYRSRPWFIAGWLWFVGVLLPASGLVRVGLWPALADRFAYLPEIGVFAIASFAGDRIARRGRAHRIAISTLAGVALASLGIATFEQVGRWHDSIALFTHTLRVTGPNVTAYDNLANALAKAGREREAVQYLESALAIDPSDRVANGNLADALRRAGRLEEAIEHYRRALASGDGDDATLHSNLGVALLVAGKPEEAANEFRSALGYDPDYANAHYNLGVILADRGDDAGAIREYLEALRVNGGLADAHANLGAVLLRQGLPADALREFEAALRQRPNDGFAHSGRGMALARMGRKAEAIAELQRALALEPGDADATRELGRLLGGPTPP